MTYCATSIETTVGQFHPTFCTQTSRSETVSDHYTTKPVIPRMFFSLFFPLWPNCIPIPVPQKKQLQPFIHSELVNQIQRQQISRTRTKHCQYFLWTWVPSLTEMSSNLLRAALPLLPITGSKQENKRHGCQCGKLQKYFQESLGPHLSSWDQIYKSSETQQLRIVVEDQVDDRLEATGHRHVSHNRMTGNDWNIFGKGSHNSTNLLR